MKQPKITALAIVIAALMLLSIATVQAKENWNTVNQYIDGEPIGAEEKELLHSALVEEEDQAGPQIAPDRQRSNAVPAQYLDGITKTTIKMQVGPGPYDNITVVLYQARGNQGTKGTEKAKIVAFSPGRSLTDKFYIDEVSIEEWKPYLKDGYVLAVFNRREANIPATETNLSFMKDWTVDSYMRDTYLSLAITKLYVGYTCRVNPLTIDTTMIGHSQWSAFVEKYKNSNYNNFPLGKTDRSIGIDMAVEFDPDETQMRETQSRKYNAILSEMNNGKYHDNSTLSLIGIAKMALANADGPSKYPGLTNIQFARMFITKSYLFDPFPYSSEFYYLRGDVNGLATADEQRFLRRVCDGAVPNAPSSLNLEAASLLSGKSGIEPVDSPTLAIGIPGGFGKEVAYFYTEKVGKIYPENVETQILHREGHLGYFFNKAQNRDLLKRIFGWIKEN